MSSEVAAEPAPTAARSAKFIVFLVVFIDLLGFGIVLPLLPRFADQFLAGASDGTKGVVIGLLYSSFSIMQFAFAPMWGRLSDRIGRRPVLVIGLVGSVLFYALFGYACGLPASSAELALTLLMLSRIGAGIAGANIGTAAAVIADCTTPDKRAKGMALIGAAFGIGFTFGPLIAYFGLELFQNNPGGPGFIAAGLSAIALGLAIGMLPETLPPGPKPPREGFGISRTIAVLKNPIVGPLILLYFLAIFAFANFEGTLSLFTKEAFQLTERDNFLVFAYIGFVLLVAQGGIYRPLVGRKKEAYMLKLGAGLMLLGLGGLIGCAYVTAAIRPQTIVTEEGIRLTMHAVTGLETQLKVLFYGAVTVAVVGFAFVNPSVSALVSRRAEPGRQGEIIGVNQSAAALGRIAGPFVGNVVFWLEPARMLPFVVGCVLTFGAIALLPRVTRTPPTP
jgi:DHA1 family tetracycline resistance protein-like MFS transporter